MTQKVKPIKPELRGLIEGFLAFEQYYPIFKEFASVLGYHGNDMSKVKQLLFIPDKDGEITFSISGMYELLLEYQILAEIIDKEPYKSLLTEYPGAIGNVRVLAQKILEEKELGEEDLIQVFDPSQYEQHAQKDTSSEKV